MSLPAIAARVVFGLVLACSARAEAPAEARAGALDEAWAAVEKAMVRGPASVPLAGEASLALPKGRGFVPRAEAAKLMQLMGNSTDEGFLGLVVPLGEAGAQWLVAAEFRPAGYVKDDDAAHWKADELLQNLKDGTESGNVERKLAGMPELEVTRWVEPPVYDASSHRLVWSAEARLKNDPGADPVVNYNTLMLGRAGYVSLLLMTSLSQVEHDKPAVRALIDAVSYTQGKRYADFKPGTDKVAAFGLAALIAGVAAKKLGLIALVAAGVVKFAKLILVAIAAIGAAVARWLKARGLRKDAAM
jgi:uncharacterized membrane-anchored protein